MTGDAPSAYEAAYCPRCGTETDEKRIDGRLRCWCPECDVVHWRAAVPVVGVAVVDRAAGTVLAFEHDRTGKFDLPSGHQELPESAAETAARELREETNLAVDPDALELFDVTVKRHPLGRYNFSTTFVVAASETTGDVEPETDADVVEWTTPTDAAARESAFVPGVVDVIEAAVDAVGGVDDTA
ncbi:NUDIX domain-containing protein [Halorubellus salinus]|uniref:NUDIX domain-containing protein n=1 Tax=Halorubellus salinus TaxID=755309 RepID=UPI001D0680E2|nr:NUDIX domain-containing protein [Halorubellus salinus]